MKENGQDLKYATGGREGRPRGGAGGREGGPQGLGAGLQAVPRRPELRPGAGEATQAAFLTAWAAEELRSDDAFVAQCRAAVPSGMLWTWSGSPTAFYAMREAFPTAGASIPGGEAYDHVMKALRVAAHGSASESASGHVRQESTPNGTTLPNAVMFEHGLIYARPISI